MTPPLNAPTPPDPQRLENATLPLVWVDQVVLHRRMPDVVTLRCFSFVQDRSIEVARLQLASHFLMALTDFFAAKLNHYPVKSPAIHPPTMEKGHGHLATPSPRKLKLKARRQLHGR